MSELRLQSRIQDQSAAIVKIKNKFNPSDMLTKSLTKAKVAQMTEHMQHVHEEGRPEAAPKLAIADGKEQNSMGEVHTVGQDKCVVPTTAERCSSAIAHHILPADNLIWLSHDGRRGRMGNRT